MRAHRNKLYRSSWLQDILKRLCRVNLARSSTLLLTVAITRYAVVVLEGSVGKLVELIHVSSSQGLTVSEPKSPSFQALLEPLIVSGDRLLVIEVMHGLCNRLRAFASAAALSLETKRQLVVVWEPNVHTDATFEALFNAFDGHVILSDGEGLLSYLQGVKPGADYYDYMSSTGKGKNILTDTPKHIYVRSSFELSHIPPISEVEIQKHYRKLSEHITYPVRAHLNHLERHRVPGTRLIGAHVRMLVNLQEDIPGIQTLSESSVNGLGLMYEAETYRTRCHVKHFLPKLENELNKFPASQIFVASDSQEAIETVNSSFHNVIFTGENKLRKCYGTQRRGIFCSQLALSEFIFLTFADVLFTSQWSSATDLLRRLHEGRHSCGCAVQSSL